MTSIPSASALLLFVSPPWIGASEPACQEARAPMRLCVRERSDEGSIHLTAHLDGGIGGIEGHIRPTQRLGERAAGILPAPDQEAAFAIEHLAPFERALGDRGDIRIATERRPGGLLPQGH